MKRWKAKVMVIYEWETDCSGNDAVEAAKDAGEKAGRHFDPSPGKKQYKAIEVTELKRAD